jgi:alkylated DNA repair dioxygenase AlkB
MTEIPMMTEQTSLLGGGQSLPEGFRYQSALVTTAQEEGLLEQVKKLPFKQFEFQGFTGNRRTVSYGWRYDFNERVLQRAGHIPPFLLSLRETAAGFAGMEASRLQQVLVTEYDAGAGIGWHRDKAVFGEVIGISLLSSCRFRLRRKAGAKWDRVSLTAEPRSAYLLSGAARTEWEHSIPPVDVLRYSITFRNFREAPPGQ